MMSDNVYAEEHAQEIFKIALETNELSKWQSDLRKLANLTRDTVLFELLENPKVGYNEKAKVLSERLGETNPQALKLLSELLARGRISVINDISDEYQRLLDIHRGVEGTETAEITTAILLDNEDILRIANRLTAITGKPVVLKSKVDPGLIGGIIIKVGDKLIDGSIRSKLAALKREISGAVR